ncbi:hypothetical protein KIF59_23140 [Enterobacter cloacae subsp. cloacae]|nr:hypothetical protein [Enterobacter cloacae subsp. cloacae]
MTKDDADLKGTADGVAGDTITIYNGSQVVGKTTLEQRWHTGALRHHQRWLVVTSLYLYGDQPTARVRRSDRSGSFTSLLTQQHQIRFPVYRWLTIRGPERSVNRRYDHRRQQTDLHG